jgi:release factor glutamine methyltransferase
MRRFSSAATRVSELVRSGTDELARALVHESRDRLRNEAQRLLGKAMALPSDHWSQWHLSRACEERSLSASVEREFALLVRRRAVMREPLAHLLGHADFYSCQFEVSRSVLTPRPESELLVDLALRGTLVDERTTVVDVGVGSGCLLLSVLLHVPHAAVTGIGLDCSANALVVAQRNAVRLGLLARTRFVRSHWLDDLPPLPTRGAKLLLLCNPPYIESRDWLDQEAELRHEPDVALFGTPETTYAAMLQSARRRVPVGTTALLEFGREQAERVGRVAEQCGWRVEQVARDASGHERAMELKLISTSLLL